ncbi:hypothetical protein [Ornithobacterium rhinotracheale]|uniref:hypothetical protein n=1 Tax=Ornithobacterium rhinotracheale TaxID=28251 RepID=UPI0040363A47
MIYHSKIVFFYLYTLGRQWHCGLRPQRGQTIQDVVMIHDYATHGCPKSTKKTQSEIW